MRCITLPAAPVCQERCLGSRSVLTIFHRNRSPCNLLLNCRPGLCLLTSLQSTPGVSVLLVPLNELISSTQEHFSFPSCSTIAFASHGRSVPNCLSTSLASADGRTAIFTESLGKAEQRSGDREHMESVASG